MEDYQEDELELVSKITQQNPYGYWETRRLRVAGGWIYVTEVGRQSAEMEWNYAITSVFAPDPPPRVNHPLVRLERKGVMAKKRP